jgi:hypothetical protein
MWTPKRLGIRLDCALRFKRPSKYLHSNCVLYQQKTALILPHAHRFADDFQLCRNAEPVSICDCIQAKMRVNFLFFSIY